MWDGVVLAVKTKKELLEEIEALKARIQKLESPPEKDCREKINNIVLSSVMETSPVGISITDRDGIIQFSNSRAEHILGLSRSKISGRKYNAPEWSITDFNGNSFPDDQLPFVRIKNTRKAIYNVRHAIEWPNGRRVLLSINAAPLWNDNNEFAGMIATIEDVTNQVKLEKALQKSLSTFKNIIKASPLGMHLFKLTSDGELIFENANEAADKILKVDNSQFKGKTIEEAFPLLENTEIPARYKSVAATGIPWRTEQVDYSGEFIQGAYEVLAFQTSPGEMVAMFMDTTHQRRAEDALRKSEERYRSLVESSSEVIWETDARLICTYVSPKSYNIFGYKPNEMLGQNILEFIPTQNIDGIDNLLTDIINNPRPFSTSEIEFEHKDGAQVFLETHGLPIYDDSANVVGIRGISRDITDRKKAEWELEKSKALLEAVVDQSPVPMALVSLPDYVMRIYNRACSEILGMTDMPAQIGKNFIDLDIAWKNLNLNDDPIGIDEIPLSTALRGIRTRNREMKIVRRDGSVRYCIADGVPIYDKSGNQIAGFVVFPDITERKLAEQALKENEYKYRTLFDSAYDSIFMMKGNVFIDCNNKTMEMFGCSKDDIIGHQPFKLSPEYQDSGVLSKDLAVEKITAAFNGQPQFFEWKHCRFDGTLFDAEVSLNRFTIKNEEFLLAIVRDTTSRKRFERDLRISERRYQELFETVMEGLGILDENDIIIYANPAFATIFEIDNVKELIGNSIYDFLPWNKNSDNDYDSEGKKQEPMIQEELEIITVKGNKKYILATLAPRLDQNGNYAGAIGAVIDITETKNLQEFVSRAQRLEIAGRISGQIAHDFNNLLGPLTAYPDIIRGILDKDHPAMKYIAKMEQAALYIAEINQELLVLGRRGHYNLEPLNLNEVIEHVVNSMKSKRNAKQVKTSFATNLMNVNGGKSQISRVISNLLVNAWDATDENGRVEIKTENWYIDDAGARANVIPQGEYVKVTIRDNGCGITDNTRAKIFDPFFTTKKADVAKGSGLGLSVVHAVVEDHNGFIDIDSEVGIGTTFYLYFPITREEIKDRIMDTIEGGHESILVVDDDPTQREIATVLLSGIGYKVTAMDSGEKAIEMLKNKSFDLLLLDMIMPESIDGAETYRRALEINPEQRAIIVSGYAETGRVKEAIDLGASSFIRKPLTIKTIAKAVRMELDKIQARKNATSKILQISK